MHGEALKIRIAGPPQDQRANAILVDFIAEKLPQHPPIPPAHPVDG
jgi:uncharacterized protein YggU (UPF0235/DUF167 family)